MINKEDWVWYGDKKCQVIHIYHGTGFCEIREENSQTVHLVHPDDLKIAKDHKKTPEQ